MCHDDRRKRNKKPATIKTGEEYTIYMPLMITTDLILKMYLDGDIHADVERRYTVKYVPKQLFIKENFATELSQINILRITCNCCLCSSQGPRAAFPFRYYPGTNGRSLYRLYYISFIATGEYPLSQNPVYIYSILTTAATNTALKMRARLILCEVNSPKGTPVKHPKARLLGDTARPGTEGRPMRTGAGPLGTVIFPEYGRRRPREAKSDRKSAIVSSLVYYGMTPTENGWATCHRTGAANFFLLLLGLVGDVRGFSSAGHAVLLTDQPP